MAALATRRSAPIGVVERALLREMRGTEKMSRSAWALAMLLILALGSGRIHASQDSSSESNWRHYGGDIGGSRHSPLNEIDRGNVTADFFANEVSMTEPLLGRWRWANSFMRQCSPSSWVGRVSPTAKRV